MHRSQLGYIEIRNRFYFQTHIAIVFESVANSLGTRDCFRRRGVGIADRPCEHVQTAGLSAYTRLRYRTARS